jgi:hypothetical protein
MHELSDTGNEWKSKKDNDTVSTVTNVSQVKQSYMPSVSNTSGFNHHIEETKTHQSFIGQ